MIREKENLVFLIPVVVAGLGAAAGFGLSCTTLSPLAIGYIITATPIIMAATWVFLLYKKIEGKDIERDDIRISIPIISMNCLIAASFCFSSVKSGAVIGAIAAFLPIVSKLSWGISMCTIGKSMFTDRRPSSKLLLRELSTLAIVTGAVTSFSFACNTFPVVTVALGILQSTAFAHRYYSNYYRDNSSTVGICIASAAIGVGLGIGISKLYITVNPNPLLTLAGIIVGLALPTMSTVTSHYLTVPAVEKFTCIISR